MRRNRSGRGPTRVRRALRVAAVLAVGIWLGVAVGLATRQRGTQPPGPPQPQ